MISGWIPDIENGRISSQLCKHKNSLEKKTKLFLFHAWKGSAMFTSLGKKLTLISLFCFFEFFETFKS
jgi:hypothetical protein